MGQMGFMIMQCGLGAFAQAIYHIVAHSLFKAALFLGAGSQISHPSPAAPASAARLRLGVGLVAVLIGAGVAYGGIALVGAAGPAWSAPETVLLAFAVLAAAQAAATLATRSPNGIDIGVLIAVVAVGTALYVGGVGVTALALGTALPADSVVLGPVAWTVVAVFAVAWIGQLAIAGSGITLPPALYARLYEWGRDGSGATTALGAQRRAQPAPQPAKA